jgi:hypothetical protein
MYRKVSSTLNRETGAGGEEIWGGKEHTLWQNPQTGHAEAFRGMLKSQTF